MILALQGITHHNIAVQCHQWSKTSPKQKRCSPHKFKTTCWNLLLPPIPLKGHLIHKPTITGMKKIIRFMISLQPTHRCIFFSNKLIRVGRSKWNVSKLVLLSKCRYQLHPSNLKFNNLHLLNACLPPQHLYN